jgi:hypothetical protein
MKKKLIIPLLTLAIILCTSLAVYAVTMSGSSQVITGYVVMTGKSTTSTSESWAQTVQNYFYQDGVYVDSSQNYVLEGYSVSCSSYGVNQPGTQFWESFGHHVIADEHGQEIQKNSYASKYW